MKKQRVAFYLHALFNGGIERVIFNLAAEFSRRGLAVDLVVNTRAWSPMLDQLPAGVTLVNLGARRFLDRPFKLAAYLRRERPAVLLSSQHYSNELAVLAGWMAGGKTRICVWEHTQLSVELSRLGRLRLRRWSIPFVGTLAYSRGCQVISVSRGVADDVASLFGVPHRRIAIIYNPVLQADHAARCAEPLDHPWFADPEIPVVVGVGRLHEQKDFPTLLNAFAAVRRVRPARLLILGEGSCRRQLQTQANALGISADFAMPGFVHNPFAYISRSRVFVLSSAWEGFANVLVEALAAGTAVVSTDCPSGPSEVLDHGRFGALVPTGDAVAMADEILKVLDGTGRHPDLSAWLVQFTASSVADRFMQELKLHVS